MSQDSKKNPDEKKKDPRDRRKLRNPRKLTSKMEKETIMIHRTSAQKAQKLPAVPILGTEQHKPIKAEPDEVLKITEEENAKYKKKEIQSNWSKYEMPIESYEEVEEQESGADYEKLVQAPISIGGYFQFKHEKSWDVNTGPSLYDKYFDINRNNLSFAVSTIPFYERIDIDQSLYSEYDILTMNNRATKYKHKYYNDKSYATPETEAQNRILNNLKEGLSNKAKDSEDIANNIEDRSAAEDNMKTGSVSSLSDDNQVDEGGNENTPQEDEQSIDSFMNMVELGAALKNLEKLTKMHTILPEIEEPNATHTNSNEQPIIVETATKSTETSSQSDVPVETKSPVIQSPEDLEKWLDDLLLDD